MTVKNGAIKNVVGACIQEGGFSPATGAGIVHSATIKGITFFNYEVGVTTVATVGSVIKDCVFIGDIDNLAILARPSPSDEQFISNTFVPGPNGMRSPILVLVPARDYLLDYRSTPLNGQIPRR